MTSTPPILESERTMLLPPSRPRGNVEKVEIKISRRKINAILKQHADLRKVAVHLYAEGADARGVLEELQERVVSRASRDSKPSIPLVALSNASDLENGRPIDELIQEARISANPDDEPCRKSTPDAATMPPPNGKTFKYKG